MDIHRTLLVVLVYLLHFSVGRFFRQRRYGFEDPTLLILDDAYRRELPMSGLTGAQPYYQEKRVTEREINDLLRHTWIG